MKYPYVVVTFPEGRAKVTECATLCVAEMLLARGGGAHPPVVWARGSEQEYDMSTRVTR